MTGHEHAKSALLGATVGNYRVEELIGKGGMGEVYLARHPFLGKEVAIKVLAPSVVSDEVSVKRFQQEARAACRVGHPAIVEVMDFGSLPDGRSYTVMERLTGLSLREHLDERGPMSLQDAIGVIIPVVDALASAHDAGIVHRDIKPDNIFLARQHDGTWSVKVLDFGVAKLMATSDLTALAATQTGTLVGTPLYMSPEQASGESPNIGPATDVYAVGAVLFHMLAGRPPFVGTNFTEVLVQHLQAPPPSVRSFRPDLAEPLDDIIGQCLAKKPEKRFLGMKALLAALNRVVSERQLPASDGARGPTDLDLTPSSQAPARSVPVATGPVEAESSAALATGPVPPAESIAPESVQPVTRAEAAPPPLQQPPVGVEPQRPSSKLVLIVGLGGVIFGGGAMALTVALLLGRQSGGSKKNKPAAAKTSRPARQVPEAPMAAVPAVPRPASARTVVKAMPPPIRLAPPGRQRPTYAPDPAAAYYARPHSGLTGVQLTMGRKKLVEAKQAARKGLCHQAVLFGRMAYKMGQGAAAVKVAGRCACKTGKVAIARWAYARLSGKSRAGLVSYCAKEGVTLP